MRLKRQELIRALWLALIPGVLLFVFMQVTAYAAQGAVGLDSHAYWLAANDPDSWYSRPPRAIDAYLYSPLFAQMLKPLGLLPWPAFQIVWALLQIAALAWLLAPMGPQRGLTLGLCFVSEVLLGNVFIFLAVMLALMVKRLPGAVALAFLTKIGPGVSILWFVGRREWRRLVVSVGSTAIIVLLAFVASPGAWSAWISFLLSSAGGQGFGSTVRLLLACLVVLWAARHGQAWLLAPAVILACPVLGGLGPLAVLSAVPRLLAHQRAGDSARTEASLEPSEVA